MRMGVASVALGAALTALTSGAAAAVPAGRGYLGPALGFAGFIGTSGGVSLAMSLEGSYLFSSRFLVYGAVEYTLGNGAPLATPRHTGSLGGGLGIVFDAGTVVPWLGIGVRGMVVGTLGWTGGTVAPEVRLGFEVPIRRDTGLLFQGFYAFPLLERDQLEHIFGASAGFRATFGP